MFSFKLFLHYLYICQSIPRFKGKWFHLLLILHSMHGKGLDLGGNYRFLKEFIHKHVSHAGKERESLTQDELSLRPCDRHCCGGKPRVTWLFCTTVGRESTRLLFEVLIKSSTSILLQRMILCVVQRSSWSALIQLFICCQSRHSLFSVFHVPSSFRQTLPLAEPHVRQITSSCNAFLTGITSRSNEDALRV